MCHLSFRVNFTLCKSECIKWLKFNVMKKSIKQPVIFALIFFSAMLISSCADSSNEDEGFLRLPIPNNITKPEGGFVSTMKGNVTFYFPSGAVKEQINIVVNEFDNSSGSNYSLKVISIEPLMSFFSPVIVRLKYDSLLLNGEQMPQKQQFVVYHWEKEADNVNGAKETCIPCCINNSTNCVEFCILQTGVFAVDVYTNQNLD